MQLSVASLELVTQGVFGLALHLEEWGAWELSFPALTCPSVCSASAAHTDSAARAWTPGRMQGKAEKLRGHMGGQWGVEMSATTLIPDTAHCSTRDAFTGGPPFMLMEALLPVPVSQVRR